MCSVNYSFTRSGQHVVSSSSCAPSSRAGDCQPLLSHSHCAAACDRVHDAQSHHHDDLARQHHPDAQLGACAGQNKPVSALCCDQLPVAVSEAHDLEWVPTARRAAVVRACSANSRAHRRRIDPARGSGRSGGHPARASRTAAGGRSRVCEKQAVAMTRLE
jgi:hypothetical protein